MSDKELIMEIFRRLDDNFDDLDDPMSARTDSEIAADALEETLFNIGLDGMYERKDGVENGIWVCNFKILT